MTKLLYRLGLLSYHNSIKAASLFSAKAKLWHSGRKDIWQKMAKDFEGNQAKVVWVHCASLGEFEQGRPLIEALKKKEPTTKILLTFFSPSGYEVRKNYQGVDWIYYLPIDSPKNARKFIEIVQPNKVIFVKYEFWYYYLKTLQQKAIPTYLVSAIFRSNQVFFKAYGALFREMLTCFTQIFVQDTASKALLNSIDIKNVIVAGDTRLDRVVTIQKEAKELPLVANFCQQKYTLVAGSTWAEDEVILAAFLKENLSFQLIIAPHQIDEKHLQAIEKKFAFAMPIRYSILKKEQPDSNQNRLLIIDNIGMLNQIYRYAHLAYIGGGFGAGIHNCLEAVVYGIPVLFGGNHHKFKEAKELIKLGIAREVKTASEIEQVALQIQTIENRMEIAQKVADYFDKHAGATEQIMEFIA